EDRFSVETSSSQGFSLTFSQKVIACLGHLYTDLFISLLNQTEVRKGTKRHKHDNAIVHKAQSSMEEEFMEELR
ncbi:hypothetical protein QTP70_011373, partial [Hemibagrus guttatus]